MEVLSTALDRCHSCFETRTLTLPAEILDGSSRTVMTEQITLVFHFHFHFDFSSVVKIS